MGVLAEAVIETTSSNRLHEYLNMAVLLESMVADLGFRNTMLGANENTGRTNYAAMV